MKRGIWPEGGWWCFLLFMVACFSPADQAFCGSLDDAIRYYQAGELDEAKRLLLGQLEIGGENPDLLYHLARVEENGKSSKKYLEDLNTFCPDWTNRGAVDLALLKYEFCRSMHVNAVDFARGFEEHFPLSHMLPEVLWIRGCSLLADNEADSALIQFKKITEISPGSDWAGWARLCVADCFLAGDKYDEAVAEYRKVLDKHRDSEVFAFALSGLIQCFTELEDSENALLYHNLLKERYPNSLESVAVPRERIRPGGESGSKARAERVVGVRYTIQLGVFAKKENARRLRSDLEKQGYSVEIRARLISGKKYYVVRLGSFSSYQEALDLKKTLESQTNESYRIVIR